MKDLIIIFIQITLIILFNTAVIYTMIIFLKKLLKRKA